MPRKNKNWSAKWRPINISRSTLHELDRLRVRLMRHYELTGRGNADQLQSRDRFIAKLIQHYESHLTRSARSSKARCKRGDSADSSRHARSSSDGVGTKQRNAVVESVDDGETVDETNISQRAIEKKTLAKKSDESSRQGLVLEKMIEYRSKESQAGEGMSQHLSFTNEENRTFVTSSRKVLR